MATEREIYAVEEMEKVGMEDRLSNLPVDVQLQILSYLGLKQAVQTSILSKTWVSLWTWIPVLEFNYFDFNKLHFSNKLCFFDKFVVKVLSFRNESAKLDRLTFTRRSVCSQNKLKNVLDYAFSHGVKQLEANIGGSRSNTWPVSLHTSCESLTHLKLLSKSSISCTFLEPKSGSFRNLTDLFLKRAVITDHELFSGFPMLKSLTLLDCDIYTVGNSTTNTLSVHALNLSDLTISCYSSFSCCELTTPRLRFLDYRGSDFPLFIIDECLPVLDTMVVGYNGVSRRSDEKKMFDNLLSFFSTLPNAKSLMLFSAIVDILSLLPHDLAKRSSPFWNLKCLELDYRYARYKSVSDHARRRSFEYFELPSAVQTYLFHNSPDAVVTKIYPTGWNKCKT